MSNYIKTNKFQCTVTTKKPIAGIVASSRRYYLNPFTHERVIEYTYTFRSRERYEKAFGMVDLREIGITAVCGHIGGFAV